MSVALRVYERLTETGEDPARAKVIAEGFEQLEERHPGLEGLATQGHLSETELRLQKEIKQVEAALRIEIKEVEARLRKDLEQSRREGREMEVRLTQAIHRQTLWVVSSVGAVVALIRLLEWFLTHVPQP